MIFSTLYFLCCVISRTARCLISVPEPCPCPGNLFVRGKTDSCYLYYIILCIVGIFADNTEAYEYLAQSIASFYEPEDLLAMIREAGFAKVKRRKLTFGVVSVYAGIKQLRSFSP